MRILQVLNTLGAGGAEQYAAYLSSYLVAAGDEVVLVAAAPFTIRERFPEAARVVEMTLHPGYGQPVYSYFLRLVPNILALFRLLKRERIDLVHTHLAASALPAWIAAKLAGVPVVHSKMHTESVPSGFERVLFRSPLPGLLVRRYLAFSDYIAAEIGRVWRAADAAIIHSSIGVDAAAFDPGKVPRQVARASFALPDDVFVVGVVARLYPEKHVELALAGFAEMKDRNAVLLIGGDGPMAEDLRRLAQEKGVAGRVRFLGQQADPRPVLAAADVAMQTTRGPNMGLAALEALSMGVPLVIAARDANEVEMAEDTFGGHDAGWVVAAEPVRIGALLDEAAADHDGRRRKAGEARRYVLERHDRHRVFAELRTQYAQLIARQGT